MGPKKIKEVTRFWIIFGFLANPGEKIKKNFTKKKEN
jgi:hypothetical protein